MFGWGRRVLARLPLRGDEVVLDAGCGAGQLTALLAERLPHGHVVALDLSLEMLERARERLAPFGDRVSYVLADVAHHVQRPPVDAFFSTATFHWVEDHDTLFGAIASSLRPGGTLVSQCGGGANLSRFRERTAMLRAEATFAPFFRGFEQALHFPMPDESREQLERTGFVDVRAWLEAAPVALGDARSYAEFVACVIVREQLARLPSEELRHEFIARLVALARGDDPPFELDCWRLNLDAIRG